MYYMLNMLYFYILCFSSLCIISSAGNWKSINPKDTSVIRIADLAVKLLEQKSNSLYSSKLIHLNNSKIKIVGGLLYKFEFTYGTTSCRKNVPITDECVVSKPQKCDVTMLLKPWQHSERLSEVHCSATSVDGIVTTLNSKSKSSGTAVTSSSTSPRAVPAAVTSTPTTTTVAPSSTSTTTSPVIPYDNSKYIILAMKNVEEPDKAFNSFKSSYNKTYKNSEDEIHRFAIFKSNLKLIVKLQQTEKGSGIYGPTEFSDLSTEEFAKTRLSPEWDLSESSSLTEAFIPDVDPPASFDWREHKAVTGVKNQESCGSCWAFSTTGNIEGQYAIKYKNLKSFSEQELVDCDKIDQGCSGGLPSQAYQEIIRIGGLESESEYPYEAVGEKCNFTKLDSDVKLSGAVNISSDETKMAAWLFKNGPISIGINANGMQFYMGGISHPWKILCNPKSLDHGVLIVGYGVRNTEPYWIVKNSWGPSWGEKGYYLVYRGEGVCGLNQMATSAIVL